jgi:mono/diheme cytochrome c family protein
MKRVLSMCAILLACGGCRLAMHDQPKHEALESSSFFKNGSSARPLLPGTIPRGYLRTNAAFFEALNGTNLVNELPMKPTRELLQRGRERFDIYCSVCHGLSGDGDGMIVQRGFPPPPSFHMDRLRQASVGHFYRVITYGYGVMFPYAVRVEPKDRWAIAAYIRALQLSRNATLASLPASVVSELEEKQ